MEKEKFDKTKSFEEAVENLRKDIDNGKTVFMVGITFEKDDFIYDTYLSKTISTIEVLGAFEIMKHDVIANSDIHIKKELLKVNE